MVQDTTEFVAIDCKSCGIHGEGIKTDSGKTRCGTCGQFGKRVDGYCETHDVCYENITGYESCPMCQEEQRMQQLEQERMARRSNQRMHPTVDSPRY